MRWPKGQGGCRRRRTTSFPGLSGRERIRAISALLRRLSAAELRQYDEALRTHQAHITFDADSKLSAEEQARLLQAHTIDLRPG